VEQGQNLPPLFDGTTAARIVFQGEATTQGPYTSSTIRWLNFDERAEDKLQKKRAQLPTKPRMF